MRKRKCWRNPKPRNGVGKRKGAKAFVRDMLRPWHTEELAMRMRRMTYEDFAGAMDVICENIGITEQDKAEMSRLRHCANLAAKEQG